MRQLRVPVVVLAINLFTAFGQVMFQVPQIRRLLDLAGHLLCFLNHLVELSPQGSVEGFAGDALFWPRPNRCVLVGIAVLSRRWAAHVPILRGRILSPGGTSSL